MSLSVGALFRESALAGKNALKFVPETKRGRFFFNVRTQINIASPFHGLVSVDGNAKYCHFEYTSGWQIGGYNDLILSGLSRNSCLQSCLAQTAFVCLSLDYKISNGKCYLSASTRYTVSPVDFYAWPDEDYYALICTGKVQGPNSRK